MTPPAVPDTARKVPLRDVDGKSFDYIIVGGGTSGCLLASRLAAAPATPRHSVLLIEAGGEAEDDVENLIPGLVVPKFGNEAGNWLYETTPQGQLNDRTIIYPRGRGMGGSSANNFSSWVRGPRCDWDAWAQASGDDWWRWDNAVDYLKLLEDFHPDCPPGMEELVTPTEGMHNVGGPIGVGTGKVWQSLVEHCVNGALQIGQPMNTDYNDGDMTGIAVGQLNVDYGERRSSAAAFLGPSARKRLDNLVVVTGTICQRLLFDGKRVTGLSLLSTKPSDDETQASHTVVNCRKEVILSAGTFETPHILLLSGVGPAAELSKHDIPLVADIPGVGQKIRDHVVCSLELVVEPSIAGHNQVLRNPTALEAAKREYAATKTGPLAVFGASAAVVFARLPDLYSSKEFEALPPDLQEFLLEANRPSAELWLHGGPVFYPGPVGHQDSLLAIVALCQNVLSKGALTLQDSDPRTLPRYDPAYLTEPYDWRIVIETIKLQLRLAKSPALESIIRHPLHGPGRHDGSGRLTLCDEQDEEAMRRFIRETLTQGFHAMGSCVMGAEGTKDRVVDADFKVIGIENLRVADMSVCPVLTNNHTQVNAYLIGERCAQVILGDDGRNGYASRL